MNGDRLEQRVNQARLKLGQVVGGDSSGGLAVGFEHDGNVARFAVEGLGLQLYPRQATLLKTLTCNEAIMTAYDHQVLDEWANGYRAVTGPDGSSYFDGSRGTTPDVLERLRYCHRLGRTGFSEVTLVGGRRSSKTFIAAILIAFKVSELLGLGDPQAHLGIPETKRVLFVAMSTTRDFASRDAFGDLAGMIRAAPVFDGLFEHPGPNELRLWTPAQVAAGARDRREPGLIVVSALPTVATAGRGPAIYGSLLDEFGHLSGLGPTSTAADVHRTLSPAMAQFQTLS